MLACLLWKREAEDGAQSQQCWACWGRPPFGIGGQWVQSRAPQLLTPCPLQLVTACAMQAFHSLFSAQASVACLPAELNAQIITVSVGCH